MRLLFGYIFNDLKTWNIWTLTEFFKHASDIRWENNHKKTMMLQLKKLVWLNHFTFTPGECYNGSHEFKWTHLELNPDSWGFIGSNNSWRSFKSNIQFISIYPIAKILTLKEFYFVVTLLFSQALAEHN